MTMTSLQGTALNHRAHGVRNRVKSTLHQVQHARERVKARVEEPIRDRPVRSILLTAGGAIVLGFLAGMLTGRKTV